MRRGLLQAGEKVQCTDRKGNHITLQLVAGGKTDTQRGVIYHDDIIGHSEGIVVTTRSGQSIQSHTNQDLYDAHHDQHNTVQQSDADELRKPWKRSRAIGGMQYTVLRPRLMDFILSMPRGAQIMYPKDIAQVLELGDIRPGMRVLESGGGSAAMSLHLLEAVGEQGQVTTIEMRPEFAKVCEGNATVWFGKMPHWWDLRVGDFDAQSAQLPEHYYDRVVLDMLDPWNRLDGVLHCIAPGGVLVAYITTTTQMSRLAEALRDSGHFTEPQISELIERSWKADALAVRPQHDMIGHTGFLVVARAMSPGVQALTRKERVTKDAVTDIDSMTEDELQARLEELTLRDISDRKLRKVLRDLDTQIAHLPHIPDSDQSDTVVETPNIQCFGEPIESE